MNKKDKVWVYDIEQFKNFHSITLYNVFTKEIKVFIIYDGLDQLDDYVKFLKNEVDLMIGFNNVNYDYPMLHFILKNYDRWKRLSYPTSRILKELYDEGQRIISSEYSSVRNPILKQIDLYRIHHFDNKARATSLKWIEFALKWDKLQDLPLPYYHVVEESEIEEIIQYNLNDVLATNEFFKHSIKEVKMRASLSKEYGLDLMNANDPKIGSEIFASILSKEMGINSYRLKEMRTSDTEIDFGECILPTIEFQTPGFQKLLDYLKRQVINNDQTKGFFSQIPISEVKELVPYFNGNYVKYNANKRTTTVKKLHVLFKGLQYDYGTGGLHACIKSGIYEADKNYMIVDIDVASFYPNLAIKNRFFPKHLSESFCEIYETVYNKRAKAKKEFKTTGDKTAGVINDGLKLGLNGVYGKSNDRFSFFYDPSYTMSITINGQLLLTMLAENIMLSINDCTMLQVNTDGLTVKIKREDYDRLMSLCKDWEAFTDLELEYAEYSKMVIRDVNNYCAVYTNGKVKQKGCFEVNKAWHKDHSMRIVALALEKYYTEGVNIEDFIRNHDDIYDFCMGFKTTRGWRALFREIEEGGLSETLLQKTNRFLITNKGGTLMKIHDDGREVNVQKGYKVTIFNTHYRLEDFEDYDINHNFYIRETYKIINAVCDQQTTLF